MSKFSGKCDLYCHIAGQGGWYDRNGNPVKMGEGSGPYYSNEMNDFLAFKKATGGVIYQHMKIKVDPWNQDLVEKKCPGFKVNKHTKTISDKRTKKGEKEITYYTYTYYGKEYDTLKDLNKKHVYITKEIKFNTLLDIIPYYPYIVSSCCSSDGKQTVFISSQSYVDEQEETALQYGRESSMVAYYRKELQDHYREVVLRWFNPTDREVIEKVHFDKNEEGRYLGKVKYPIDENFDLNFGFMMNSITPKSHWTSPKIYDAKNGIVEISDRDAEYYLSCDEDIYYVKAKEPELYLG